MMQLPPDIFALVESEKVLGASPNWDDKSDKNYIVFSFPLTVGGIATGGFQLRVKVSKRWVDQDCMAQLEYLPAGKRTVIPLSRAEWRPLSPHTNDGCPTDFAFATIDGSHFHPFVDNYLSSENRMRSGNLPAARPFPNDLNTLTDFLAYSGKLFRIKDIDKVRIPSLSANMFWVQDDRNHE